MDSWLGVEVRHLATLAAVDEEGSFRGAASRLGYVQSAVSQQIAGLEALVGTRLVDRRRGHPGVELTESGRTLLHHADRILSQLSAAQADLRSLAEGRTETLAVGVYQSVAVRLLPRSLATLAESSPEVRVQTREELGDGDLFAAVAAGELDAAFAELPLEAGPFDSSGLLVDPLVLLVPATSPLAGDRRRPTLERIAAEPFVTTPTWRMFDLVAAEFRAAGLELDRRLTARTHAAAQALVGAGLGVAVTPRLAADVDDPTVAAIPLDHLLPATTLACYWHRDRRRTPALERFLDAVRSACEEFPSRPPRRSPPAVPA